MRSSRRKSWLIDCGSVPVESTSLNGDNQILSELKEEFDRGNQGMFNGQSFTADITGQWFPAWDLVTVNALSFTEWRD